MSNYNYKIVAETVGPFSRGDVVPPESIDVAGLVRADLWAAGAIEVTGAAPTAGIATGEGRAKYPYKEVKIDAAGNPPE